MQCPQCGRDNLDTARHCNGCGATLSGGDSTPLVTGETDLRHELAVAREAARRLQRYVPSVVAEGILHDQERLRGERRQVAVLFVDAVDFTRLSASLDAEPVFNLINGLLGRLMACVHRYDGVVDKFTGDGLMAVFGAPIAHENNAELAVRAALDMQRAAAEFEPIARAQLGAPLKVRIGVHNGLAIAGIIGTEQQAAYTVIGETVNMAARLESLARPGCILVSSPIYHRTLAFFDFQTMGAIQVKGIDHPVAIYETLGQRSEPLRARGVAGVQDVFLGRDTELEQLDALVDAFLSDRRGRLVMVKGEAGMGKSRLVSEALSDVPSGQAAIWHGRGLPYAQGVGYGVFRSLLQDALRTYAPDTAWDSQVSPALRPFLRQLLGELSPQEQASLRYLEPKRVKQLTALAMREWLLNEAQRQPVVLILDDFHWADDLSRDMLQSLANLVHEAPVLLGIITRPQPEALLQLGVPAADEPLAVPASLALTLKPLSPEHSRMLLGHLVDLQGLPEQLVNTILTRAEGNPFYIEEFVRMLIEKEVLALGDEQWRVVSAVALQELEIPTSLRGLMMARVDRLPEDLQHVLRNAAVIGLQFTAHLLQEIVQRLRGIPNVLPLLERLTELGLLTKRPQAGEQVYAFRHILTQETVYNNLMRGQRPELHHLVAECIETLYETDLNNQAEVLALHYDRARVRNKAMHYSVLAGDRARERFASREALNYYGRALQLSQHLSGYEDERWQAAVGLGEVQQHVGQYEEAIACYRAALEDSQEATLQDRALAMLRLGQVWDKRGDLQEAEGWLHQGLALLSQTGEPPLELHAQLYSELGWLSLRRGDVSRAQEQLEQSLALVGDSEHYGVLSSALDRLGAVYYHRGEWERSVGYVERGLELREQLGDIVGVARSSNNLGILKHNSGDWRGALESYQRSLEFLERIGDVEGVAIAHTNVGNVYIDLGEWDQAEENLGASFAIAQRIAHPYELAQAHMNLGRLYLLQERWEKSAQHLNSATPLYTEADARTGLNDVYHLQARLHLEQGQLDGARQWTERNYELLQEVTGATDGESVEWGRHERLMGRIAHAQGDLEAARHHLERSAAIFGQSPLEAGRTACWLALLWSDLGQPQKAREELITARQHFEQLGAAADLGRVEEQLARLAA